MSDDRNIIEAALEQLHSAPIITVDSEARPTIIGGQFAPARLRQFLDAWQNRWDAMPWRVWEYVHSIAFADDITNHEYLQRAEVFGAGGHLSLRRDGNRWLWHYIGPDKQPAPEGFNQPDDCEDFWSSAQGRATELRRYDERALLWGEWNSEHSIWREDRVAVAVLKYPGHLQGSSRVYLSFWRFTENGQTAFVWYRGLEDAA